MLEALGDIGDGSSANLAVIHPFTEHPSALDPFSGLPSMLQLTGDQRGMELKKLLNHPEPLVRRGALLDLGATGWLAAVPSIRSAAVEPSLKLVALREVAERNDDPDDVLDAMDRTALMTITALDQALQTLERATSTPELVDATQALCALNDLEAAKPLVKVLGFNNPAVAAVATQGLIQLGRDIVPILLVSLDARNYGATGMGGEGDCRPAGSTGS